MDQQNIEARNDDWLIPLWVKATITFFACSGWLIFVLSLRSEQKTLFGLSAGLITSVAFGLVLSSIPLVVAFWFFPHSALVLFLYWLIRFFRKQICIFALLGAVYLITVRAAPLSIRGGIPAIDLILLLVMALLVQPVEPDHFPLPWMRRFFTLFEKMIGRVNSVPIWFLRAVVALLPIAIVCTYIYLGLNASLQEYGPYSSWEDETAYWLRLRSFSHVGLNAGYNVPNEVIAPAAFSRYGEGSPLYIYLYGSIARLMGWSPQLPILVNFVILALAIFLFTYFAKLDPLQTVFTGLIAILTWPILLYLPLTTHETLNQAIGFMLAIVFFKLLTSREQIGLPVRVAFVVLVYVAALIRLSWGLLLVPVVFYALDGKVFRRAIFAVLLGLGLYISATLITSYLVPPANNSIFLTMKDSLTRGPQVFMERIGDQFVQMFRSRKLNANIAVMFQIATIIGWSMIRLARLIKSRLSTASILQSRTVFDIYNMATLALAGLVFYLQSGFARTFTPSVLLVYLLQAARKDYKFLGTLLVLNLAFFSFYMGADTGAFRIIRADFGTEFPQRASLQTKFEKWIVFDPATPDPWCNTLLIPLAYYDYRLTVVPPGIGISFIADDYWTIQTPVKSKYLLFDRDTYELLADQLNVKLLESSSIGDLYYNLDSGCAENQ
ncbi:MAG: hypothetical protein JW730_16355 [Anaerolineales bacterium]|nr:hypothetical protein [Anaerolineales bacterium]